MMQLGRGKLFAAFMLICVLVNSKVFASALTDYVDELTQLLTSFKKLDKATADQMASNERYLLAKDMLHLSANFYQLMLDKQEYLRQLYISIHDRNISPNMYSAVVIIEFEIRCIGEHLRDRGARIGALVDLDGASVESVLRSGLQHKSRSIGSLLEHLSLDQSDPKLEEEIIADADAARTVAEELYKETARFAHVLDPSVIPQERYSRCDTSTHVYNPSE
jgi:hypothetical protein